jgi:glycerophosphoryl diester phosphodiesterase
MKKNIKYSLIAIIGILVIVIITFLYWRIQPYYKKYHYVAHALGGIEGLEYSNSLEALNSSYSMGTRLMEVDLLYTSDGHLICRHKWSDNLGDGFSEQNIPDYNTFISSKINNVYTTLDIESIIRFAMENPDVYFITDTKSTDIDICEMLEVIKDTAKKLGYKDVDRQFIIQFYNYDDYERISQKFSFQNYIFTLYRMKGELKQNGIANILDFCVKKDIKVVTLPKEYATKEICRQLKENGITSYVHTVDSRKIWFKFQLMGIDGIYTNDIYPLKMFGLFAEMMIGLFILSLFIFLCCAKTIKGKKLVIIMNK